MDFSDWQVALFHLLIQEHRILHVMDLPPSINTFQGHQALLLQPEKKEPGESSVDHSMDQSWKEWL